MATTQPGGEDWDFNVTDERIVVYAGGVPLLADGRLVSVQSSVPRFVDRKASSTTCR